MVLVLKNKLVRNLKGGRYGRRRTQATLYDFGLDGCCSSFDPLSQLQIRHLVSSKVRSWRGADEYTASGRNTRCVRDKEHQGRKTSLRSSSRPVYGSTLPDG